MDDEKHYYGGNLWQAPSYLTAMIVSGPGGLFLISNPAEKGSCANVPKDGKWRFTLEELKERLKDWKWIGTHRDYINQICKESLMANPIGL